MPSKVGERCATCKHATRLIIESSWPPEQKDCGLMCQLDADHRTFVKPLNTCSGWEQKEVSGCEWNA